MTKLNARQKAVIVKGAKNVEDFYELTPKGGRRFRRAAINSITMPGVSDVSKAYRNTIVKATRGVATPKEARGVKKIIRRADRRT